MGFSQTTGEVHITPPGNAQVSLESSLPNMTDDATVTNTWYTLASVPDIAEGNLILDHLVHTKVSAQYLHTIVMGASQLDASDSFTKITADVPCHRNAPVTLLAFNICVLREGRASYWDM